MSIFFFSSKTVQYASGEDLTIYVQNCRLFIREDNSILSDVALKYRVPIIDSVAHQVSGNTVRIQSNQDPLLCEITVLTKSSAYLSSLEIICTTYCSIVQDSSILTIQNDLTISGDNQVYANFAQVSAQNVYYTAGDGYVQLNNALLSGSGSTLQVSRGDIIVQSTKDFSTSFTVPNSSYCASGPNILSKTFGTGCDQSGSINETAFESKSTTCQGSLQICTSSTCNIGFTITAQTGEGNYYANLIPQNQEAVQQGYAVAQGALYDFGIQFNQNLTASIQAFPSYVNDASNFNPGMIIDLGNSDSRSSLYTKWVISSNPSYAYMRPWWLSTFSASLLTTTALSEKGFLYPGFCPWKPIYDQYQLYDIQELYTANNISYLTTVIWDKNSTPPPYTYQASSLHNGIQNLSLTQLNYYGDYWYSFSMADNGALIMTDNNIDSNVFVVLAIVLSLVLSAYGSIVIILLMIFAFKIIYRSAISTANHAEAYAKYERSALDSQKIEKLKKPPPIRVNSSSINNFLKSPPSIWSIIDYLAIWAFKYSINSVDIFYSTLFAVRGAKDLERDIFDTSKYLMKGSELKLLYEKYCFLMRYQEKKLTDKPALDRLKQFGFKLSNKESAPTEVLVKLALKKEEKPYFTEQHEGRKSLEIFKDLCLDVTAFDTDQLEVEAVENLYFQFCEVNHLDKEVFSSDIMQERFGIESTLVPLQFIQQMDEEEFDDIFGGRLRESGTGLISRFCQWLTTICQRRKTQQRYIIDRQRMQNLFNLLTDQFDRISGGDQEAAMGEVTLFTILPRAWPVIDFLTVGLHIYVVLLLTLPSIFVLILNEMTYSQYSLKDPSAIIPFQDWKDPYSLVRILLTNSTGWDMTFFAMALFFWVIMLADLPVYYLSMEFPQEKAFSKGEKKHNLILRISRTTQWVLVVMYLLILTGYAFLVLVWLVLGAIINPTAFLPLASSALTFAIFVKTKYESFKRLKHQGMEAVLAEIDKLYGGKINKIMKAMSSRLSSVAKLAGGFSKNLVESPAFQSITGKVSELGLVDEETIRKIKQKAELLSSESENFAGDELKFSASAARDPLTVLREIDSIADEMKKSAIHKLTEESKKREIPDYLVEAVIQMSLKDMNKLKPAIQRLLVHVLDKIPDQMEHNKQAKEDISNIVSELLFPDNINQRDFGTFISSKVMNFFINKLKLEPQGFDPTMFQQTIQAINHLKNSEQDKFGQLLPVIIDHLKEKKNAKVDKSLVQFISRFLPLFEILGIIMSSGLENSWKLKAPLFRFISKISGNQKDKPMIQGELIEKTEDKENVIEKVMDFLNIFLSRNELPSTWKEFGKDEAIPPSNQRQIIKDFFAVSSFQLDKNKRHILSLVMHYLRQEPGEIPLESITMLQEALFIGSSDSNPSLNKIFPFAFKQVNSMFLRPQDLFQRIDKCAQNLSMDKELATFVKLMLKFLNRDLIQKDVFDELQSNAIMKKISENIRIPPEVLIDLLALVYYFVPITRSRPLIETVMKRMGIDFENYSLIESMVTLYLSLNEEDILRELKYLDLKHGKYLLISKRLLNPYFMSKEEWDLLGDEKFKDSALKAFDQGPSKWKEWLNSFSSQIRSKLKPNSGDGGKKKEKEKEENAALILAKAYFGIKEGMKITHKGIIEDLEVFHNDKNNFISLTERKVGHKYSPIDVIYQLASLNTLQLSLDSTKRTKLEKDEVRVITLLAQTLGISQAKLELFLQIPMLGQYDAILKSFDHFLDTTTYDKTALKKFVEYTTAQMDFQDKQLDFLQELPSKIRVETQPNLKIPVAFIKKLYMENEYQLTLNDVLELTSMAFKKEGANVDDDEESHIYNIIEFMALLKKGALPEADGAEAIRIKNKALMKLMKIMNSRSFPGRLTTITSCFKERNHPAKTFVALLAFLTGNTDNTEILHSDDPDEKDKESVTSYLCSVFKVFPEMIDLFNLAFEKNAMAFCKASIPIVRRICGRPILDKNNLESILCLLNGEKFSSHFLAEKLSVKSHIVDFFICAGRLNHKRSWEEEIDSIKDRLSLKRAFKEIAVDISEFTALFKIAKKAYTMETLPSLLRDLDVNEAVRTDYLQALMQLAKGVLPNLSERKSRSSLEQMRTSVAGFLKNINLNQNYAFIISNLVGGTFTVLDFYSTKLAWIFPLEKPDEKTRLVNLAMGLCGAINFRVEIGPNLSNIQAGKSNQANPSNTKAATKVEKSHTFAYASQLLQETLGITSNLGRIFLFDPETYNTVFKNIKEILVVFVLNLARMPEFYHDLIVFYEFLKNLDEEYNKFDIKDEEKSKCLKKEIGFLEESVSAIFQYHFDFQWENLEEFAKNDLVCSEIIGEIVGKDNTEEVCGKIQQQFLDLMPNENQGPEESESFKGPFELYQKHFSNPNLSFAGFMFEFMRKLYRKIAIGGSETTGDSYINTKNCFGHYSMFRTFFLFRTPKLGANTNYTRVIWNLHHLMTCIERQTLLEPLKGWEVFPKFRMMKLVSASIGFSYSTIVEYSLSDSLFPQSYVRNMQKAQDNDQKKKFFQEYIEGEVISCIRELNLHRVSSKNNNSSKPMRFEYISGFKTEAWKSFWICDYGLLRRLDPKKIKQLRHWDSFMSYFNYEKTIFGNPALGNFSIPTGIEHANEFFPYENTSLEEVTRFFKADMQVANLYCSLELISHIESNKNTKEELKDYRTGLPARDVMRCMVKFENSLNHSNMALILGILSDKMEVLFRKDNVIGQESPESAKIYAALLTVSTFSVSRKKDNQKVLRDVITSTLSKYLDSETVRLQELLYFTLTGKGQLKEISATFDIPVAVSEFLTNCITYKSKLKDVTAGKEQDEQEDETENTSQDNFDLEKALGDVLQINELELKTIYCLLQLYWGRRKQGWEPLLLSLLNNNTSVKNDRKNNIFIKLRKSLDLNVLQKNYAKKGERSFLAALKSTKPDEPKEMELFEIMFNCISPSSKQPSQDKDLLKSVIQFIKIIVNVEKRELFNFAYTFDSCGNKDDEKEGKSDHFHEKNEANLCQICREFQLDDDRSLENDIKLLRFLIIVNIGDSVPLFVRNRDIIDHVLKRGFDQISNVNEANQALVYGVLNWKIERIMFALKKKGHYETYLTCHSIFILLHFNKFLKPEKIEERQIFNLAARLFLCSIRSSMFSNVIHEEGSNDLLEDLSIKKFIEKIEKPVEKRFEDIHWQLRGVQRAKAEKKIPEVSLVELISKSLEPLEAIYGEGIGDHAALEPNQSIGKNLEEQLTNAITMILSGEIFKALLMNKTEQKNLDKNFPKLLKFILDSHKQLTENSSKGGSAGSHNQLQSENAKKTITSFLQVIQQDKSKNLEDLLDLFFIFQGSLNSEKLQEKIIDKIVSILTNILTEQNVQPEYQKIIFSLVQLITDYQYHRPDQKKSYDQNQPNEQKKPKLVKKSLKFKKKIEIFFAEFIQNLLPDLKGQMIQSDSLKNPQGLQILTAELIQNLINLFEILYQQYPKGIANKDLLKNIMPKVMSIISELQILPKQVTEFLLGVVQGNLKSCTGILVLIVPDQTKAQAMEKFILQVADTIDLQQITSGLKIDLSAASQKDQIDEELSKIRAGSSDPHLLFRIVDKIGNGNGLVDTVEFQRLTNRMGIDLSEHRVLEIFSKVRIREGIQQQNLSAGLTEPEFIKAFQFLQNKNVFTAMTLLGITPTQLALIFTVLIILLVLLLAFIYLGIIAFSIGGSFGAVINSLFPVAGGLGLGKQGGDIKAKLDLKNIETSVENALNIVQSDKL